MVKQYELLESKIKDPVIREGFRRIRQALQDLDQRADDNSSADTITNVFNSISVWRRLNTNANALSSTIIDQVAINDFSTIKYILSIEDTVNNKTRSMEIIINNENGSLTDSVPVRIGSGIDFSISSVNNSGTMELTITNNEANGLAITAAKLVL